MRKFEVGKRYGENAVVFEIIKRTAKTITYAPIYHAGRYNESKREEKKTVSKAAVLSQKAKQAREAQKRITPTGMTYGEYMEYLKDKRQQLEEKKKNIHE